MPWSDKYEPSKEVTLMIPEHVRKYIYALGTPVGAVLVFYGLLSEQEVALWLAVLGAVLLVGEGTMAAKNTSGRRTTT